MMKSVDRTRRGFSAGLPLLFCVLFAVAGCQSNRPAATVEIQSTEDSRKMDQRFSRACFSRDAGGDYDIILLEQYEPVAKTSQEGGIAHVASMPLTQVLHIKVLWRAKTMIRADAPTATNCTLRYTVLAGDDSGAVTYDGVGFVNVYGGSDQVRVILSNARINPSGKRGTLEDPIGKASLEADFKAQADSALVKSVLAMTREAVATPQANPPARPPSP